jgi:hypothetical protein
MHDHATPTTANVKQAHAGMQPQFATNQIVLGPLRVGERRPRAGKVRTRIGHRLAENQTIEVAGDVVVVGNRLSVTIT